MLQAIKESLNTAALPDRSVPFNLASWTEDCQPGKAGFCWRLDEAAGCGVGNGPAPLSKLMLLQLLPDHSVASTGAVPGRGRTLPSCLAPMLSPCGGAPPILSPPAGLAGEGAAPEGVGSEGWACKASPAWEKACRLSCTASMSSAKLPKSVYTDTLSAMAWAA